MPFTRPIIAGGDGSLVIGQIRSPNYQSGIQGWSIKKDGSAEFNNVTTNGDMFINFNNGTYDVKQAMASLAFSSQFGATEDLQANEVSTTSILPITNWNNLLLGNMDPLDPNYALSTSYLITLAVDIQAGAGTPGTFVMRCRLATNGGSAVNQSKQCLAVLPGGVRTMLFQQWAVTTNNADSTEVSFSIVHTGTIAYTLRQPHTNYMITAIPTVFPL